MRRTSGKKTTVARTAKAASIVITVAALAALIGCQGLSESGGGTSSSQQSGNLVLGTASLDFGSVSPNTSKSLVLTITNSGNKTVTISGASVSTKYFALTSPALPVSLDPGLATNLNVSFTP